MAAAMAAIGSAVCHVHGSDLSSSSSCSTASSSRSPRGLLCKSPRHPARSASSRQGFVRQARLQVVARNADVSCSAVLRDESAGITSFPWSAAPTAVYGVEPRVVATTQSPAQATRSAEADVMGLLLRQRIVFLGHQMDDFVADAIVSQLLLLDAMDPKKTIRLFVNCPGGSISAAMGIYDAIQLCRAEVSTIAFGLAASTAAIVLAGGSKGKRFAMPNARIMMHQPLGGASGQAIDVEIQAKEIMYHKSNIIRIVSEITGRSYEQVEKDIDRDRYMSPVEAMEYGLIDGVIDQEAIIPLAPNVERVARRKEYAEAESDPRKFLIPVIPDDEIY